MCYVLAAVLAALNLTGLAVISWWWIVALALFPIVFGTAFVLGCFLLAAWVSKD